MAGSRLGAGLAAGWEGLLILEPLSRHTGEGAGDEATLYAIAAILNFVVLVANIRSLRHGRSVEDRRTLRTCGRRPTPPRRPPRKPPPLRPQSPAGRPLPKRETAAEDGGGSGPLARHPSLLSARKERVNTPVGVWGEGTRAPLSPLAPTCLAASVPG